MQDVINEIKSQLTGDENKDRDFLLEKVAEYRDNKEMLSEIYKMLFELLPKDTKDRYIGKIAEDKFSENLKNALELLKNRDYTRAVKYLDETMMNVEKQDHEDDKFAYMTFRNTFEAYFYSTRDDVKKIVRNAKVDYGTFYKFKGYALSRLNRFDEAREAFEESLKWNPYDFETIFENIDTYYKTGDYETYYKMSVDTLKIAFANYFIAQCYHNMGKYYMLKNTKDYDTLAYSLITYSIFFAETEYAYHDLNTLCVKYGWEKKISKPKDVMKTFKKYDISDAPDMELIKKMIMMAQSMIGRDDEFALQVFRMVYAMTRDEITAKYIEAGEKVIAEKRKQAKN